MKKYDQLTIDQKEAAVRYATSVIKDLIVHEVVDFGNGDQLTDTAIGYYAKAAAQGSFYSDSGDVIVEGITE